MTDFDRLHTVLDRLGYTKRWRLEAPGTALRKLYNELDLQLSETLRSGVLDELDPAQFAAIMSIFTYEARGGEMSQAPHARFADSIIEEIDQIWERISSEESDVGLEPSRPPDVGLVDTIHGWAEGLDLDELFEEDDLRAGDFVRSARQVLDLLRQVRDGYPGYRTVAQDAISRIDRGIVAVGIG